MSVLIAQGPEKQQRWRRPLPAGGDVCIGRASGTWATPWDEHISREHVRLEWDGSELQVKRLMHARNPVFFQGRTRDEFQLGPGEHFVIGATTFTRSDEEASIGADSRELMTEAAFSPQVLRRMRFRPSDQRIEVLSRLPRVVTETTDDAELYVQLINLVLLGIPSANSAALVARSSENSDQQLEVLHWDRHSILTSPFQVSETLVQKAASSGEGVVHAWQSPTNAEQATLTQRSDTDWAFAVPVPGDACRGQVIYVDGRSVSKRRGSTSSVEVELRDDLKFAELVAHSLGNVRDVRALQRSQSALGQFFSPVVMQAIAAQSPDAVLTPREANVSVLFSDLRGFTRTSEESSDDLFGLLHRVSGALGVTTKHVLENGGVIGDLHGDSAMGFWGWPLDQDNAALLACLTALAIRRAMNRAARQASDPLHQFRLGVGIASGTAVAGKIGTDEMVKVTVFGPVVNLASRLEGLTSLLHVPILIDDATSKVVRSQLSPDQGRVRCVGKVRPAGFDSPVLLHEVLPSEKDDDSLSDQHLQTFEEAVAAFMEGDWDRSYDLLHQVPASDRAKDYLTLFMVQNDRTPPLDWDGVVSIDQKSKSQ